MILNLWRRTVFPLIKPLFIHAQVRKPTVKEKYMVYNNDPHVIS